MPLVFPRTGRPAKIVGRTPVRWIFRNLRVPLQRLLPTGLNRPIFAYFCGGVSLAASARFGETAGKATEKGAWGVLSKAAAEHLQNVLGFL